MKTKAAMSFRFCKAPGDGDISGDYNDYAQSDTITVSDREVTLKGNDDAVNLAIWAKDRYTYAVSASAGLSAEGMSGAGRTNSVSGLRFAASAKE